jgi:hypothetical protein
VKQLCDDLRQFAIQVRQIGLSVNGGVGEKECLDLSDRMLAAVQRAESRNGRVEMAELTTATQTRRRTGAIRQPRS